MDAGDDFHIRYLVEPKVAYKPCKGPKHRDIVANSAAGSHELSASVRERERSP